MRPPFAAIVSLVIGMAVLSPQGIAQQTTSPGTSTQSPPATSGTKVPSPGATSTRNRFKTAAQAQARCPSDTIVWAISGSKIYHYKGTRDFGKTRGAYMCEKDAIAGRYRAAKNETRPMSTM